MIVQFRSSVLRMLAYVVRGLIHVAPTARLRELILQKVYRGHLAWRDIEVSARTRDGSKMKLTTSDTIQSTIFMTGEWEPAIGDLIRSRLRPGDTFIDVGANVGYFSLLASQCVGTCGKVVAIEASPTIFANLRENVAENNATNITVANVAVSSSKGTICTWLAPASNLGHSTIVPKREKFGEHKKEVNVEADTLDGIVGKEVLLKSRLVKIDIEGAERLAIEGVHDLLAQFDDFTEWVVELSSEFSPEGQEDVSYVFDVFADAGYKAYQIQTSGLPVSGLDPLTNAPQDRLCDVLFTKRSFGAGSDL